MTTTKRCGVCEHCKTLEHVKRSVLRAVNPPFSYADQGVVDLWNAELRRLPCLAPFLPGDQVRVARPLFDLEAELFEIESVCTVLRIDATHGYIVVQDTDGKTWHLHPEALENLSRPGTGVPS